MLKSLFCGALTLVTVGPAPPRVGGFQGALSAIDIESAAAWGRSAHPDSYILRDDRGNPVGVVYTPYMRVALAARAEDERKGIVPIDPRSEEVTDPFGPIGAARNSMVYIAYRMDGVSKPTDDMYVDISLKSPESRSACGIATGKAKTLAPAYLQYGLDLQTVYAVTCFKRETLAVWTIVELRYRVVGDRILTSQAVISATDLRTWK